MLGPVPRTTAAIPVRQGLAVLQPGERTAVHDRRLLLLFLVDGQPDPIQFDVDEVQAGVPGDAVRPTEEPHIQGPAVQFPGHDRPVEHDDQHHRVSQVGTPAGQTTLGRRFGDTRRPRARSARLGGRRAGDDLAGQRERAVLQDVAQSDGRTQANGSRGAHPQKPELRNANRKSSLYRYRN